jgi:hypothetical protein
MIKPYMPTAWFWIVGGDTSRAWSSEAGAYVKEWDIYRVTRIANEAELNEVLANTGLAHKAPSYVPKSVYMWQAKTAIAAIGKLQAADNAIDATNNPALMLAWHTAPEISRASPAVAAIGALLGLSDKDIDALFIQAANYKV